MDDSRSSHARLARKVYSRVLLAIPVLWAILFIPAGTLAYWEAWLYLAILLIPMFFVFRYLLKHTPSCSNAGCRCASAESPKANRQALLSLFSRGLHPARPGPKMGLV